MQAYYHPEQKQHNPKHFLSSGTQKPNPEVPERVDMLLQGVKDALWSIHEPDEHGLAPIAAVHSSDYLTFLQHIYRRWQYIEEASDEVIPNIHPPAIPTMPTDSYPRSAVGQAGYHMADTACPISSNTWNSAYWSAQSAIEAANQVLKNGGSAYALCRPPGHHAFAAVAGGFCFLNNSAIVAQLCSNAGRRPAIVDVDLHHGNGTQGIFYSRSDVLTVSIHADPQRYYPFFWGHAHERGHGEGTGANLNLPIPRKTGDDGFLSALETGLERVNNFAADILIIALGLDAFEGDPFAGLSVTTDGFRRIASACAELQLPTIIVQEGGYLCPELGLNLTAFLEGIAS